MTDAFRERPWMCFDCGYTMDAASMMFETSDNKARMPIVGDFSVCMNCAAPYTRTATGWRRLSAAEIAALSPYHRRQITVAALAVTMTVIRDLSRRGGRA